MVLTWQLQAEHPHEPYPETFVVRNPAKDNRSGLGDIPRHSPYPLDPSLVSPCRLTLVKQFSHVLKEAVEGSHHHKWAASAPPPLRRKLVMISTQAPHPRTNLSPHPTSSKANSFTDPFRLLD